MTDDTQAFKLGWVATCRTDFGTLLVPRGYSFMINSAIFLGPCQGSITFQVTRAQALTTVILILLGFMYLITPTRMLMEFGF